MFDAIVLAGGKAARLDGVDKPGLDIGGRTLLDRVIGAVRAAQRIVVVGPRRADIDDTGDTGDTDAVIWCREDPPGGGPVAGIAAGLEHVTADHVLVLAADLPDIAGANAPLLDALRNADAAVLVDSTGRRNYLAAAWRTATLRARLDSIGQASGVAARSLFDGVTTAEVEDTAGWGTDCDTWDDVARARERALAREAGGTA
ncbi:MAG TPA: NTP transferase domain-containing protein [Jatrophihabitantaceae bacterium]|nr:NTP transferase domain-containing protein [Jatrophihabitantaceae bacterium]